MKQCSWRIRIVLNAVFVVFLLESTTLLAFAEPQHQTTCPESLRWQEHSEGSFVIIFTGNNANLAQEFISNFADLLEVEFQNYAVLFGIKLETPITVRIYPSDVEYYCLNALAPLISSEDTHSHIGSREIALIGNVINRNPSMWSSRAINAMRHEFAVLYAEKITDGKAPPGLLKGIGGYFENPAETFEERFSASGNLGEPDRSLQRLWEEDVPASNLMVLFQQTSVVAYLIDTYGWSNFFRYLETVSELPGYRQALSTVYNLNIQEVQGEWERYFPLYRSSRWQTNIVHSYDLDQFDTLIAGGAYQDALTGLEDALPIVTLFGEENEVTHLEEQLRIANHGVLAGNLTLEARQAILSGNYAECIEKAEQAISIYNQLGDGRRISELEVYSSTALEILTLRTELVSLKGFDAPLDPQKTQRILQIGQRLSELGDAEGVKEVQLTLILLSTGQRYFVEWTTVIGLLVCVYLIYRRLRDLRQEKPPEVNLL
jgi:hypothetical protein